VESTNIPKLSQQVQPGVILVVVHACGKPGTVRLKEESVSSSGVAPVTQAATVRIKFGPLGQYHM